MNTSRRNGFTLVETLVVLVIMGLLATTVVLSWPTGGALRDDARALAARATLAAQDSILAGRPTGLAVTGEGYAFYELTDGHWTEMGEDRAFRRRIWRAGVVPTLARDGLKVRSRASKEAPRAPGIVFDPTGLMTQFSLVLAEKDARIVVASTDRGVVEVKAVRHD